MMDQLEQARADLCEIGRRMYAQHWVAANDGNMSVRVDNERVVCTPTFVSKGFMAPEQLCVVDLEGHQLSGPLQPSSEVRLHLACYRHREDVRSVCHTHCPHATAFAAAEIALDQPVLTEVVATFGGVPLVPYGRPGTDEIWQPLVPYLEQAEAFLLAHHGVLTLGADAWQAYARMEAVEHFARIMVAAQPLGGAKSIPDAEVDRLQPPPGSPGRWYRPRREG